MRPSPSLLRLAGALALVCGLVAGAPLRGEAAAPPSRTQAGTVAVQGVAWDAERQAYVVKASGELSPRTTRLDNPARLVIDLPGTKLVPNYQALEGQAGSGVSRVRVGQFQANTTRIVLDLARPIQVDVEAGGHEATIVPRAASAAVGATVAHTPTIRAIRHRRGDFAIVMSRRAPYWSHVRPSNGQAVRYMLVFPNTRLAPSVVGSVAIGTNGVQRLTASQAGSEARIELELSKAPTFDVRADANGWRFSADQAQVAAAGTPRPAATPKPVPTPKPATTPRPAPTAEVATAPSARPSRKPAERIGSRPRRARTAEPDAPRPAAAGRDADGWPGAPDAPLALRKHNGHWQMLLTADDRFRFRTSAVGDDRLHVDIEGAKVALPRDSVYIDNGLIARVRVGAGAAGATRLTIDLDQPVRHSARLLANQRSLLLGFHRVGKDRVTLDPGHGGSDSGTTGQHGTKEKDVTLAIATRLARVMEANGMAVQMTRMKDLEILLRPRVEMANRADSDVFVSIHANSFGNQHGVNGIETYYFNDDSYPLARSIHKSLLRSLGRPDRGVRKNNFYVVHHTKMPAALIEIGYLSNAEEEALLASPAYQERAAQAIYAGIRDFMASRKASH